MVVGHQRAEFTQTLGDFVEHRARADERDVLIETCDPDTGCAPHRSAVGRHLAADDFQQARLTGPVAADERYALAGVDLQRRILEERVVAEGELQTVDCE